MGFLPRVPGGGNGGGGPPEDRLEARPGDRTRDVEGREATVRSIAVYDQVVEGGEPGDAEAIAIVWTERERAVSVHLVQRDTYGEPGAGVVEVLSALEADGSEPFREALRALPAGAGYVTVAHPGAGPLEGDRQLAALRRADGPDAGGCPDPATVALLFRHGSADVRRFHLVVADEDGWPHEVWSARTG